MKVVQLKSWEFYRPDSDRALADWDEGNDYKVIGCLEKPGQTHMAGRGSRLSVKLPSGKLPGILWTGASECMLQEDVVKMFEREGFTGYKLAPVKVRFKRSVDAKPPPLWELKVTGWGGVAPPEAGFRIDWEDTCVACLAPHYSGPADPTKLIDPEQWDGSDFFMVWPLPKYIFVTDRVAKFIRKNKIRGVKLRALADLDPIQGAAPGPLAQWVPKSRIPKIRPLLGLD